MWIVELEFTESNERLQARPQHRALLEALHREGEVKMAGPLANDSGAIIVFDVPSEEAVNAAIAADPYFATPGVTVLPVREWQPFISPASVSQHDSVVEEDERLNTPPSGTPIDDALVRERRDADQR